MEQLLKYAQNLQEELIAHRRWLHAHPETGFSLEKTLEYVRNQLKDIGCEPIPCGKAGLTAMIHGKKEGKVMLLRADMDALPIPEESGEEFASKGQSMHACGHDLHTAMLLGAAKLLIAHQDELCGSVKLMFQPAEELLSGAKDMIDHGVLDNPKPDAAMMIHVTTANPLPTGTVVICAGGVSAPAADYFTIRVQGKGCHGSSPQLGVDAISTAAHILLALQEIQAREVAPDQAVMLTVGKCQGGTAANVIADSTILEGTLRTHDEKIRQFLKKRICQVSQAVAQGFRAQAMVEFGSGCPALINDNALSKAAEPLLKKFLGKERVISAADFPQEGRNGGSEDFAYVSHKIPSFMIALSAGSVDQGYHFPLHHPKVKFDEQALPIGAAAMAGMALGWLANN